MFPIPTVRRSWNEFRRLAVEGEWSGDDVLLRKLDFYAGYAACLSLTRDVGRQVAEETMTAQDAEDTMEALDEELWGFFQEIRQQYRRPCEEVDRDE